MNSTLQVLKVLGFAKMLHTRQPTRSGSKENLVHALGELMRGGDVRAWVVALSKSNMSFDETGGGPTAMNDSRRFLGRLLDEITCGDDSPLCGLNLGEVVRTGRYHDGEEVEGSVRELTGSQRPFLIRLRALHCTVQEQINSMGREFTKERTRYAAENPQLRLVVDDEELDLGFADDEEELDLGFA